MSEALYERYKDALRRGHVAALRARYDVALAAYGEASKLAPDRALPFVGVANVLTRLGRDADALAAFDAALDRAPADEAALRGRADLLIAAGDRARAAETLDRLAGALDGAGRIAEATDAARRALELAESRGRRDAVRALVERLRGEAGAGEPAAQDALAAALHLLEEPVDLLSAKTGADGTDATLAEPEPEPFDPGAATAAVENAAAARAHEEARTLALVAAAGHRAAGSGAAAIDACYLALGGSPADPDLHLALAELYLDRGWRTVAADKLVLLGRLADLTDDAPTATRICEVARARLTDEPRLADRCA